MRRRVVGWAGLVAVALVAQAVPAEIDRAEEIVRLPYEVFAALPHEPPFDWSSDGCSVPFGFAAASARFAPACRLHDFGYRNFGGRGRGLRPTEATRRWIDERFLTEMLRLCADPVAERPASTYAGCLRTARTWFWTVRSAGRSWFS
jgi:hypothetical protein